MSREFTKDSLPQIVCFQVFSQIFPKIFPRFSPNFPRFSQIFARFSHDFHGQPRFTPIESGLGGMMIGAAAAMAYLIDGRITGISGAADGFGWAVLFFFWLDFGGEVWRILVEKFGDFGGKIWRSF